MLASGTTTTMSKISADRDSLVALDALLRIGGSRSPDKDATQQIQSVEKPMETSSKAKVSSKVRGNAGMLLPQMDNSSAAQQLAAFQAAGVAAANLSNSFAGANFSVHAAAAHLLNRQAEQIHAAVAEQNEIENTKAQHAVRKEKVEAALRSKPQRGRKREDLSETERLELTRTRNREHAKSTRIRKKARYQELLDCEQKLIAFEKMEALRHKRSNSVLRFLSIRQKMVNNGSVDSDYTASINTLDEVVCSISNFQFETARPTTSDRRNEKTNSSDIANMKEWDMSFVKQVTQCYGPGAERFVEFKAVGGASGIALSKDGSGFTHVEIVLNVNEHRLLITGTLSFQFAPESDQIRSAAWTTVHEYCAPAQETPKRSRSANSENLGNLLVHPSVVSLDAEKALDDDVSNDNSAPGMSL